VPCFSQGCSVSGFCQCLHLAAAPATTENVLCSTNATNLVNVAAFDLDYNGSLKNCVSAAVAWAGSPNGSQYLAFPALVSQCLAHRLNSQLNLLFVSPLRTIYRQIAEVSTDNLQKKSAPVFPGLRGWWFQLFQLHSVNPLPQPPQLCRTLVAHKNIPIERLNPGGRISTKLALMCVPVLEAMECK
jgi:hypothetical protein